MCLMDKDPRLLYGESIFTSAVTNANGYIPGMEFHLERLYSGVKSYYGVEGDFESYFDIPKKFKPNTYIRLNIFSQSRAGMIPEKFDLESLQLEILESDAPIVQSEITLKTYPSFLSENYRPIKTGSYAQHLFYKRQAKASGFDDALFTRNEEILEATTSNIFFIKGESIFTPSDSSILQGTTLQILRNCFEVSSTKILIKELQSFDSVFIANAVQGIIPVTRIDQLNFKTEFVQPIQNEYNRFRKNYVC